MTLPRRVPLLLSLSIAFSLVGMGCGDGESPAAATPTEETGGTDDTGTTDSDTGTTDPDTGTTDPDTGGETGPKGDLGFRPKPNGFSFENYGNDAMATNLTAEDMKRLFGGIACVDPSAATCRLTPPAAQWMDQQNGGMGGGHCEGMAALSLLMYLGDAKISDFGSGVTDAHDLIFKDNSKLQREIAFWFVTQATDPTASGEIRNMTPSEIVDKLVDGLAKGAPESYTMGIYQRGPKAGHAITPYKVDTTTSPVKVYVYDNNFPGAERILEVDKTKNTWKYFASTSPGVPGSEYEGDAITKSLTLTPTSFRKKPQECPFCGEVKTDGSVKGSTFSFREIYLTGKANLLISDASGKKIGFEGGKLLTEIVGARYVVSKSADLWNDDQEPTYFLPFGSDLSITLDGTSMAGAEPSTVTMFAPAFVFEVDEVTLSPGQKDTIKLSKDNQQMSYKTTSKESPMLYAGLSADGDADWFFAVKGYGETGGQEITLKLDLVGKRLVIKLVGTDPTADFDIIAVRSDASGAQTFAHAGNGAKPTETMYLDYGTWAGDGKTMKLGIDTDGDGTPDKSVDLTDIP